MPRGAESLELSQPEYRVKAAITGGTGATSTGHPSAAWPCRAPPPSSLPTWPLFGSQALPIQFLLWRLLICYYYYCHSLYFSNVRCILHFGCLRIKQAQVRYNISHSDNDLTPAPTVLQSRGIQARRSKTPARRRGIGPRWTATRHGANRRGRSNLLSFPAVASAAGRVRAPRHVTAIIS